ncbi:hypothetical protein [Thiolapillus sp.]|uniref:hypothetical protein n=1 Tax=Thiolapillus sp. TaxID=2017437 RepID=UPI003AF862DC
MAGSEGLDLMKVQVVRQMLQMQLLFGQFGQLAEFVTNIHAVDPDLWMAQRHPQCSDSTATTEIHHGRRRLQIQFSTNPVEHPACCMVEM